MRLSTITAVLALALPVLSRPAPEPLLPANMSRRTINLWEKWTGADACNIIEKVKGCKEIEQDCDVDCVCQPFTGCGLSAKFWCEKEHGSLDENCDCIKPSGYTDPHDPKDPVFRRRATMDCRMGSTACLIDPKASKLRTECIDLLTTLDSCGGCTSEGQGLDCTLIPGAEDVNCEYGSCRIYSCERGYKVENGTSCVPDVDNKSVKHMVISGLTGAEKFWSH